ncbi:MAG: hypothetical protein ACXVA9_13300, partial [Bdellovibrionales bacterium]
SPLELSTLEGKAPLLVRIKGPSELVELAKGQYNKWVGCSFNVDWGDPKNSGMTDHDCAKAQEHTYIEPGVYKIKANTFHPNPNDSHTIDWKSELTVTVK